MAAFPFGPGDPPPLPVRIPPPVPQDLEEYYAMPCRYRITSDGVRFRVESSRQERVLFVFTRWQGWHVVGEFESLGRAKEWIADAERLNALARRTWREVAE